MTSGYEYKGKDIYDITTGTETTGSPIPGYNFNGFTTSYSGLRPNDFGFISEGKSVAELCTAKSFVCNTDQTLTIPENCKSIRFVGIGGGGGRGGKGGSATQYPSPGTPKPGGPGGLGGYGTLVVSSKQTTVSSGDSIIVTVGTKGNTGTDGASNSCTNDRKTVIKNWAQGGAGVKGNDGNSSKVVYQGSDLFEAAGGKGGDGGNGAITGAGAQSNPSLGPGTPGTPGSSINPPSAGNFGYEARYGGAPGGNGYVQIIYLYD
jgi:hypothetical protein